MSRVAPLYLIANPIHELVAALKAGTNLCSVKHMNSGQKNESFLTITLTFDYYAYPLEFRAEISRISRGFRADFARISRGFRAPITRENG